MRLTTTVASMADARPTQILNKNPLSPSQAAPPAPDPFVHLHMHTQYSLLEGAIRIEPLFKRVAEYGMNAVAVTDTNNLFGAIDFYIAAKAAGIKPIIGAEIFYLPERPRAADATKAGPRPGMPGGGPALHHLIVLCKNLQGYQNLCQMVTQAYLASSPAPGGKSNANLPRGIVDRELLSKYGDDLIILSGCLRGPLAYWIIHRQSEIALEQLLWFKERFGQDFYLELQDSPFPEQEQVNELLDSWGEKYGIERVATSDCHYLEPKDAEAHEILQCIEHGKNLDFDRPKSLVPPEYYLKKPELMRQRFQRYAQACDTTRKIADQCNLVFKFKDDEGRPIYHLPDFRPDGVSKAEAFDTVAYLIDQSQKGLIQRFDSPAFARKRKVADWATRQLQYESRLKEELAMIAKTGFSGYFLIVGDFINWAKKNLIPVGPGRGSGAGSLVAYALRVTDIDPIEFNLLFERFINPERISLPDFDVDFCQERRGEVIKYVEQKYGKENVSQIITFGKLQARAVLKDVGRVLGLPFADTDQITKLLPDELNITLSRAIQEEPRLREKMDAEPKTAQIMDYALALEGLYRNAGMHAAGVIITEKPVVTYCPLYVSREGDVVTQFDKDFSEKVGLVKFDFLGLKTLTVIDQAIRLIHQVAEPGTPAAAFDLETIPYDDPGVYQLLGSGDTDGVFQLESSGMKDLCIRILPNSVEDVTAINALYRPGPLGSGMVDDFIDRKHGRNPIVYDDPRLESILQETYGVILYQEQVMRIARELAGYSLGQADLLRRAMGKKKPEEMAKYRESFVQGSTERGLSAVKAESIFDLMAKFAEYGFNKSHSAAYAVLTYQTAFLKTHYPAEFMAALMTTEMDNTDKLTKYIGDSRAHRIPVLPPDVNHSQRRFSVEKVKGQKAIRFGLEAIKGVGSAAVDVLIDERKNGPFVNVLEFCRRVSVRKVNKKVLESLTLAGGFDEIAEVGRASIIASLETLLDHAGGEQAERELGQDSLFDSFREDTVKIASVPSMVFKAAEEWPESRKLAFEKQVVGFYLSGHPMTHWQKICTDWLGTHTELLKKMASESAQQASQKSSPNTGQPASRHHASSSSGSPPWEGGGAGGGGYSSYRPNKREIKIGGLLTSIREVKTKKGSRMGFGVLEDLEGKVEVIFFPEAFANLQEIIQAALKEADPILVGGDMEVGEETAKILVKTIEWLREAHKTRVQNVILRLPPADVSPDQLRELKKSLLQYRGKCPVRIDFSGPGYSTSLKLGRELSVEATPQMVESINRIFGRDVVTLA